MELLHLPLSLIFHHKILRVRPRITGPLMLLQVPEILLQLLLMVKQPLLQQLPQPKQINGLHRATMVVVSILVIEVENMKNG